MAGVCRRLFFAIAHICALWLVPRCISVFRLFGVGGYWLCRILVRGIVDIGFTAFADPRCSAHSGCIAASDIFIIG
ncbi:MAG: hypothetical protein EBU34_12785 [Alphaproteobacteria bacterium]|nr:hypothetical protein [Alphaproteobacteria bacterium]